MPHVPETRASLILRLPSAEDAAAWREFVALYEPFVYRFARRNGFQDADARELVQNVFLAVVKAIDRWQADANRARFRTWLFKIARNQFLDLIRRKKRLPEPRDGAALIDLYERTQRDELAERLVDEHRRELFRWAAARIKPDFQEATWRTFWMTSVEGQPVERAAQALAISTGAVYIARSRVIARLRDELRALEADHAL